MNLKKLADTAKRVVHERGGTDALKEDARELKDIATGAGTVSDKAKAAAAAIRDPGRTGRETGPADPAATPDAPSGEPPATPPAR